MYYVLLISSIYVLSIDEIKITLIVWFLIDLKFIRPPKQGSLYLRGPGLQPKKPIYRSTDVSNSCKRHAWLSF